MSSGSTAAVLSGPVAAMDPALEDWLVALPKAELHVHLVGSASPATVGRLAAAHPGSGVPEDPEHLAAFYRFRDFTHFITVYLAVSDVVTTPDDVLTLVEGFGADLAPQGLRYAEVTVTPVLHAMAGTPPAELAQALDEGARRVLATHGIVLQWVYDIPGGLAGDIAEQTLAAALRHPPTGLVGFGLGGLEAGIERADYEAVFGRAVAAGLHSVPHAGETSGPDQVRAAVESLRAERIGHGIGSVRDPELMAQLGDRGITLEVCPSSNVATGAISDLAAHPLGTLIAAGVPVTLNSDDPPMFATSLLEEYRRAVAVLGLTPAEVLGLARQAVEASFAPDALRRELRSALVGVQLL